MSAFARAIAARRRELGLTRQEVRDRCGYDMQALFHAEQGRLSPKWATCERLATALEWTMVELALAVAICAASSGSGEA